MPCGAETYGAETYKVFKSLIPFVIVAEDLIGFSRTAPIC